MRIQAEKQKPRDKIKQHVREEPKPTFRCSSRHCHTQDPSSNVLCDECISQQYSITSEIQNNWQETSSISSRPSNRSFNDSEPEPRKIDQTEWRREYYEDEDNSLDNVEHMYNPHGRRPEQTKPSPAKYFERSTSFETDDLLENSKLSAQSPAYASSTKQQEERSIIRSGYI
jgi:hypothetical protein